MPPKFGTSGLRGLVTELTDSLIADYTNAFIDACPIGAGIWVGRDLRSSSPKIAAAVIKTIARRGLCVVDAGAVPTPALALAAMDAGCAAVMVTGSHIPADRNGIKFYKVNGEIDKVDETNILKALGAISSPISKNQNSTVTFPDASSLPGSLWVRRYVSAYGKNALSGMRVGVWSHSAVSRDLLITTLQGIGASIIELGRSGEFIPVDTEAISLEVREQFTLWTSQHHLDAIISTDGDGDRPLLTDEFGHLVPGDILGQITAAELGADTVVTPVSSNSGIERSSRFPKVVRTKIGSPYVIAGMTQALGKKVVGYEANGGFLLGFLAAGPSANISPLATRDSLLPLIATLTLAKKMDGVSNAVKTQPKRFTSSDRLQDITPEKSRELLQKFDRNETYLSTFLGVPLSDIVDHDKTDGLRLVFNTGDIIHFRPSGNAPEFRVYTEADTQDRAAYLLEKYLGKISHVMLKK